ncbi:hypothetical protein C8Q76DRAFT_239245 [Earliella scabrosa]|nr:hypothetical protein C8Q76DRAFT_239245 [Earliella scabrosa]
MSDAVQVVAAPDLTIGAMLLGCIFGAMSYGFITAQGYMYYGRSVKEPLATRLYVFISWALDSVNTALLVHSQYHYFLNNYGNPEAFKTPVWSLVSMVLVTAVIAFMVRGIFIKSVWQMSYEHPIPTGILGALSLSNLACGILATIKMLKITEGHYRSIQVYIYLNFASAILADGCMAATLLYYLNGHKAGTYRTKTWINKLQLYVVGTGILAILLALVALVLFAAMPDKVVFLLPFMLWSKFYANAMYSSLNARKNKVPREILAVNLSTDSPPGARFTMHESGTEHAHSGQHVTSQQVTLPRVGEISVDHDVKSGFTLGKAF